MVGWAVAVAMGAIVCVGTAYYALTDEDGAFAIEGVPPGRYRLRVWHEDLGYVEDLPSPEIHLNGERPEELALRLCITATRVD